MMAVQLQNKKEFNTCHELYMKKCIYWLTY